MKNSKNNHKNSKEEQKEYLLVDGYNIIFAWDNLTKIAEKNSLEDARDKLVSILSNYQGAKEIELIIVFDAYKVKGSGSVEKIGKTNIVYTKEAETADSYIERITNTLVKEYSVRVATSDRLEQIIIMGQGALRISATELRADVKLTAKKVAKKMQELKPVKNNMLFDNLDPKTAKWFEEMRQDKNL